MDPIGREMSLVPTTDRLAARFGRVVRTVRRSRRLTQSGLGEAVGTSQSAISRIERGRMRGTSLHLMAAICDALDIEIEIVLRPPWLADPAAGSRPQRIRTPARQRDPVHARCSAYIRRRLERCGWSVEQEVRISRGRSHGFIDILAFHPSTSTLLVGEIKTELHDVGALQRTVAWYVDEARSLASRRGSSPSTVIAMVALLETAENDDRTRANHEPLRQAFPVRSQRLATIVADPSRLGTPLTAVPGPGTIVSGLAMIDPTRRRKRWLVPTSADGRRTPPAFRDYRHAALAISPDAADARGTEPGHRRSQTW